MATAAVFDRMRGSLMGLFIADSLSMPVHWYYNPSDIVKDYGRITTFQAPKERHPSSIMSLSNTGGAGRGSQDGDIIGSVINHGKKPLWGVRGVHYHHGMSAGSNTLNAVCARLLLRLCARDGAYSEAAFLKDYVAFMTTPGSHNDTYAETFHRMFFANWARGVKPEKCADDDGHNVASAGGLVMIPPVALWAAAKSALASPAAAKGGPLVDEATVSAAVTAAQEAAVAQMYLTHNSRELEAFVRVYAELVTRLLLGQDFKTCVAAAAKRVGFDVAALVAKHPVKPASASGVHPDTSVIGPVFSPACYIEHSFPALLYLAYKYADDPQAALIANTNVGGENCHRGAALGALMGLSKGMSSFPEAWTGGLAAGAEITAEIDAFIAALGKAGTSGGSGSKLEL